MHEFDYVAADDLQEVLRILADKQSDVRLLAGGTDLIVNMRAGRRQPKVVVDAKKISQLNEIVLNDEGLSIGAAVSCRAIWEHAGIQQEYAALVDSCSLIGSVQVQGRASLGGNLCNAAPSGDVIPTLIAYGAVAHILSAEGERQVPVESFCVGPGKTIMGPNELLVRVTMPKLNSRSAAKFLRFIPRNEMDIAVANAAAFVSISEDGIRFDAARVAIGAVGPTPKWVEAAGQALEGQEINDQNIEKACAFAREAASPIDDMRGTVAHRLQLVEVLTGRVIRGAIARATGEANG